MAKQNGKKTLNDKKVEVAQKVKGPIPDFTQKKGTNPDAVAKALAAAESLKWARWDEARGKVATQNWDDLAAMAQVRYTDFAAGKPGNYLIVDGDRGYDFVIYSRFFHASAGKVAGHLTVIEEHHSLIEDKSPVYIIHDLLFRNNALFADGYVGHVQKNMLELFRSVMPKRIAAEKELRARKHVYVPQISKIPHVETMVGVDQEHELLELEAA